jgi:type I restriction-modification system DNA methylase subunit
MFHADKKKVLTGKPKTTEKNVMIFPSNILFCQKQKKDENEFKWILMYKSGRDRRDLFQPFFTSFGGSVRSCF